MNIYLGMSKNHKITEKASSAHPKIYLLLQVMTSYIENIRLFTDDSCVGWCAPTSATYLVEIYKLLMHLNIQ